MELKIGLGKIMVDEGVIEMASGKFLVLDLSSKKGPCNDEMCQEQVIAVAKISDSTPFSTKYTYHLDNATIAVEENMARIIDRGRETVEIRKNSRKNLTVRGFFPD